MYSGKNLKFFVVAEKNSKSFCLHQKITTSGFFFSPLWAVKHIEIEFIPVMS